MTADLVEPSADHQALRTLMDEDAQMVRLVLQLDHDPVVALILTPREIQHATEGRPVALLPGVLPAPLGTVAGTVLGGRYLVVGIGCVETPHVVEGGLPEPDRCTACGAVKRAGVWRVS